VVGEEKAVVNVDPHNSLSLIATTPTAAIRK
jgi:hypothetical protein